MGTIASPAFVGTANTDGGFNNQSNISCHSDGTLVVAWKDATTTNIRLATSTDGGATWTQRASVNAPGATQRVAIAQYANGNVAIVAKRADESGFYHATMTWGTWAVSAFDNTAQVYGSPNKVGNFDVDVSDGGAVMIAFQMWNGSTSFYSMAYHRTPAGAWTRVMTDQEWSIGGEARRTPSEDVSVVSLGISGGVRTYVIAFSIVSSKLDYGLGYFLYRVNETTSAVTDLNSTQPGAKLAMFFQGSSASLTLTTGVKRRVKLFRTGPNEWTGMIFVAPSSGSPWFGGITVENLPTGSTYTIKDQTTSTIPATYASQLGSAFGFAIDAEYNKIFRYGVTGGTALSPRIVADVHMGAVGASKSYEYGLVYFAATSNLPLMSIGHGPRKNLGLARHAFGYQWWLMPNSIAPIISIVEAPPNLAGGVSAITALTPPAGAEQQLANPALSAVVDTGAQYSQSAYRIEWQFATDAGFTTNLITYRQAVSKRKKVEGTNTDGVTVTFADTLPSAYNLTKTVWYMRARLVDIYGNSGAWTASQTLTVGHPPTGKLTSPVGGGYYNWNAGQRTFTWDFYDPSPTDYQTAYRVLCLDANDGIVFDTGKVSSSSKSFTYTFALANKDQDLRWAVQLWDSDDTAGPVSDYGSFNLTDPTTATIEDPTPDEAMPTGVPTFIFTPSTGGGRSIKEYTVIVTKGPNIVWSKRVPANIPSGTQQQLKMEQGWLENNTNYSVQVLVTDSASVTGSSAVVPFSTAWVPPASPTGVVVTANKYNTEDEGFVLVSWDDTARDPDFTSWSLYRKADMVDHVGAVVETGEWELIYRDYSVGALYAYKDFFAPASHLVTYRIVQSVNRIGQDIDSLPSDAGSIIPLSDGYWLIEPTSDNTDADAFKLSIVTGDSFSDEQEESEFTVIGRGRIVNKGQKLGVKGTLDVQLRNTGGTTARQKRLRLKKVQDEARQLYLRNPFGDMFKVSVSNMSISRIAGVGRDEFCDVSIPYSEVS
jgi:hypothetical protein